MRRTLLFVALFASAASAQTIFSLPKLDRFGGVYAVGDIDGDGVRDLLSMSFDNATQFIRGRADGAYDEPGAWQMQDATPRAIRLADMDGDGDLDALGWSEDGVFVSMGDGSGSFGAATFVALTHAYTGIAGFEVVDLDADGDPDVVMHFQFPGPNFERYLVTYKNDGDGALALHADIASGYFHQYGFAKIDDDAIPDLVYADGALKYALGDGNGFGAPVTLWAAPGVASTQRFTAADLDRDGDQDLAFLIGETSVATILNDGEGVFDAPTTSANTAANAVVAVDLSSAPNRLALITLNYDSTISVRPGSSTGWGSAYSVATTPTPVFITRVASDELGGERLLVGGNGGTVEYWPDGAGGFRNDRGELAAAHTTSVDVYPVVADFDGDGDDDMAMSLNGIGLDYFVNDGVGNFTKVSKNLTSLLQPLITVGVSYAAAGDVDGNGRSEFFFYSTVAFTMTDLTTTPQLFDGQLEASESRITSESNSADLDGDDRNEMFSIAQNDDGWHLLVRYYASTTSYSTVAVAIPQSNALGLPRNPIAGDFDGDGDGDLAWRYTESNFVGLARQTGAGAFSVSVLPITGVVPEPGIRVIAAGDIDGDGIDDLFHGDQQGWGWLRGTSDFTFAAGQLVGSSNFSLTEARFFDFDGDRDLDVATIDDASPAIRLFLNEDGELAPAEQILAPSWPAGLADGDFDGDLRRDLAVLSADTPTLAILFGDRNRPRYNRAPIARRSTATLNANLVGQLVGTLQARDPERDALTYEIVAVSSGTVSGFNANTGAFTWTPATGFTGSATITFRVADYELTSRTATMTITVTSTPVDMQLKFKGQKGKYYPNANLVYSFRAKAKTKNVSTTQVQVTLPLPAGVSFVSGSVPGGSCVLDVSTVICTRHGLTAAKGMVEGTITVRASSIGTLSLTATARSAVSDPDLTNNSMTVIKTVIAPAAAGQ